MSEQSDPREQVEASAEQDLEPKDLEPKSEATDQVRGGQAAAAAPKPPPKGGLFEIEDWSFDP